MRRINIYDENHEYEGWFDEDAASVIAEYTEGDNYDRYGAKLLRTARGGLIINTWQAGGYDNYRFADPEEDAEEICQILVDGGYEGDIKAFVDILQEYEH